MVFFLCVIVIDFKNFVRCWLLFFVSEVIVVMFCRIFMSLFVILFEFVSNCMCVNVC